MNQPLERILIVEQDTQIGDGISRLVLSPLGYAVSVVRTAGTAIQEVGRLCPDLLIIDLNLPDLSGKDLMVALTSQGFEAPIIILSQTRADSDIIQAFRLGAADYLFWPARDAEIVSVVERVLVHVREHYERERLYQQLKDTNRELEHRVREMTTLFALGKAVTSITDRKTLYEKIIQGAVYISESDYGWLLLRSENANSYSLSAQYNAPASSAIPGEGLWEDGLIGLVGLSGKTLSIHGEPLKRFQFSRLGQAALVVPIKIQAQVFGLLIVLRKAHRPFKASSQALLEAVADYASISLVNARLFRALEERVRSFQKTAETAQFVIKAREQAFQQFSSELGEPLKEVNEIIRFLLVNGRASLTVTQKDFLTGAQDKLQRFTKRLEKMKSAAVGNTE